MPISLIWRKRHWERRIEERKIINEYILEDFEFAFLRYMRHRNEPVNILFFPPEFEYHSKIHMKPVEGQTNVFTDWMDEIYKYIHDPTIRRLYLK